MNKNKALIDSPHILWMLQRLGHTLTQKERQAVLRQKGTADSPIGRQRLQRDIPPTNGATRLCTPLHSSLGRDLHRQYIAPTYTSPKT